MIKQLNMEQSEAWLKPESWPIPLWCTEPNQGSKLHSYEDYFAHQVKTRYMELEGEFRTVWGNYPNADLKTAARIVELLHIARQALERKQPNVPMVLSMLDLVDRYMVWLYPSWILESRVQAVYTNLENIQPPDKERWIQQIKNLTDLAKLNTNEGLLRAALDDAIGACNRRIIQNQISTGLQLERLKFLQRWGVALLLVLLLSTPLIANSEILKSWTSQPLVQASLIPTTWIDRAIAATWINLSINILEIAFIGALGGFLSGLLQARSSRISLAEYQENRIKLQLKLLVGALVSIILYLLLSWKILPGVSIQSSGSYILIAFISGFSERYFLQLLQLKTDEDPNEDTAIHSHVISTTGIPPKQAPNANGINALSQNSIQDTTESQGQI